MRQLVWFALICAVAFLVPISACRGQAVAGKWTDGLSRETGQAVVRDLLQFEGFRNHDGWDEATGIVVAWLKDERSAEDHRRQGDRVRAGRSVAWAIGTKIPGGPTPSAGDSTDVALSDQLAVAWLRGSGRGECR